MVGRALTLREALAVVCAVLGVGFAAAGFPIRAPEPYQPLVGFLAGGTPQTVTSASGQHRLVFSPREPDFGLPMRVQLLTTGADVAVTHPEAAVVGDGGYAAVFAFKQLLVLGPDGRVERRLHERALQAAPRIEGGWLTAWLSEGRGRVQEVRLDLTRPGAPLRERVLLTRTAGNSAMAGLVMLWLAACVTLWPRRSVVGVTVAVGALAASLGALSTRVAW